MAAARSRLSLYLAIFVLYLLHNDLWLWSDTRLLLGLPVGLVYHVGYCLAVSVLLAMLVKYAWPDMSEAGAGSRPSSSDREGLPSLGPDDGGDG